MSKGKGSVITTRDLEIVDFIKKFKVATARIIQKVFFSSSKTCRACTNRLKVLVDSGQIKRVRDSINAEYIYYVKMPIQLKHALKVANVYADLLDKYSIPEIKLEPTVGSIRPDASFIFVENGIQKVGILEVEISHKSLNIAKYQNFIRNGENKANGFTNFTLFAYEHDELKEIPM
jgi:hypothetical protein